MKKYKITLSAGDPIKITEDELEAVYRGISSKSMVKITCFAAE